MPRPRNVHLTSYDTKAGTRYQLRWFADGRGQWEAGITDVEVAKLRQAEILTELLHNGTPLASRGRSKLSDFAEQRYLAKANLRPTTIRRYRGLIKLNIDATITYPDPDRQGRTKSICLGQMPLKRIDAEVVEEWFKALKTTRTDIEAAKAYRCLSGIMTKALKWGEIYRHPCQVEGANKERSARPRLPGDDVPALLFQAFMDYRDKYGHASRQCYAAIPIFVGYGTGMRKSEVRGLQRKDVDLDEGLVRVERQAYYDHDNKQWLTEAPTKSDSSVRSLAIQGPALDALRWHMETFMRPAAEDPAGEDLVFTAYRSGGPISDTGWAYAWAQAKKDAGVDPKLHLHHLRHQAATTVAQGQHEIKVIQEFLGDGTVTATVGYLQAAKDAKHKVAGTLRERYGNFNPVPGTEPTDNVVPIRRRSHG